MSATQEFTSMTDDENIALRTSTSDPNIKWFGSTLMMKIPRSYFLYVIGVLVTTQIVLFLRTKEFSYIHLRAVHVMTDGQRTSYFIMNTTESGKKDYTRNVYDVNQKPKSKNSLIDISNICCDRLFEGDPSEIVRAKTYMSHIERSPNLDEIKENALNCKSYQQQSGYVMESLTEKEANFPIAYSIVIYKFVPQFEHLLRAIYRPQNLYCIHVDKKAIDSVYEAVEAIVGCFQNVFILKDRIDVQWGKISVLTPEILCMDALWNKSKKWKYFINLTGQEFPLKTNSEIVDILTALNGANDIHGVYLSKWKKRFENASQIPHDLRPFKGKVHIVANRDYVDFLLHDQRSKDLLEWSAETVIPDETYFPTLNFNPSLNIPGSYKYELPENTWTDNGRMSRYKLWKWSCIRGTRVLRDICILGVDYLPLLKNSFAIFANKFIWDYDRVSLKCLDDMLNKRTIDALNKRYTFNVSEYASMDFVKNKIER